MLATLKERASAQLSAEFFEPALHVAREDVKFGNSSPDIVGIEITVRNESDRASRPAVAIVQAAPLGAFVPWQLLSMAQVPRLNPGQAHVIRVEAVRPRVAALGSPDRMPPQRLLTALGSEDDSERRQAAGAGQLPVDLFDLIGRGQVHWAGNLNVFVNLHPVERHLAQALRVYPGRTNVAMFVVGSRKDAYCFSLEGEGAAWDAALYDTARATSITDLINGRQVVAGEWIKIKSQTLMFLALCPPADCRAGTVEVHVRQRSTGKEAIVEFSLDPNAAGPGCYVV